MIMICQFGKSLDELLEAMFSSWRKKEGVCFSYILTKCCLIQIL